LANSLVDVAFEAKASGGSSVSDSVVRIWNLLGGASFNDVGELDCCKSFLLTEFLLVMNVGVVPPMMHSSNAM